MAKYTTPSKFLVVIGVIGVLLLLGATLYAAFQSQILQQHASLAQYTSIAVKGNIYLDTNKNGQKDTGEANYTGSSLPKVRVALFSETCPLPTPKATPTVAMPPTGSATPTVALSPNCYYRTMCPMIACREGSVCPTCTPTRVCLTPQPTGQIQLIQGGHADGGKDVKAAEDGPVGIFGKDRESSHGAEQGNDQNNQGGNNSVCREFAQRVIDCTVSKDGTYLCISPNVAPFTSVSVILTPPSYFYKVSSKNPVIVSAATASIDFGLVPSGIVAPTGSGPSLQGLTSGTKQTFTIHVYGTVSGLPVVMYISEEKGGEDAISGVFTTDASGNITVKVTPNDQLVIVPVASRGYSKITPDRLQVTVSHNSCGLDTPCIFSAAH